MTPLLVRQPLLSTIILLVAVLAGSFGRLYAQSMLPRLLERMRMTYQPSFSLDSPRFVLLVVTACGLALGGGVCLVGLFVLILPGGSGAIPDFLLDGVIFWALGAGGYAVGYVVVAWLLRKGSPRTGLTASPDSTIVWLRVLLVNPACLPMSASLLHLPCSWRFWRVCRVSGHYCNPPSHLGCSSLLSVGIAVGLDHLVQQGQQPRPDGCVRVGGFRFQRHSPLHLGHGPVVVAGRRLLVHPGIDLGGL